MFRVLAAPAVAGLVAMGTVSAVADEATPIATVKYACDESKTIAATYYSDKVDLVLSDGRTESLPQTMSGSGIRYANADGSFVFWSKGDTAFITEGTDANAPPTFANCIDETKKT